MLHWQPTKTSYNQFSLSAKITKTKTHFHVLACKVVRHDTTWRPCSEYKHIHHGTQKQ